MSSVQIRDVRKSFGNFEVLHGVVDSDRGRRVRRAGRPLRLRQVDLAADARRPRKHHLGHDLDRRPRRQQCPAQRARHCDGVPELRALSAHDGRRQYGLLAQAARRQGRGNLERGQPRRRNPGADAAARALSPAIVGRPAPARRHGPRHRARSAGVPVRRAVVQPRRQAARRDAHRDQGTASAAEDHDGLRHPRPDRGHDHGRQDRGDA